MNYNDPRLKGYKNRPAVTGYTRSVVIFLHRLILFLARHWFWLAMAVAIIIFSISILAPAFMAIGLPATGQKMYGILAPHDHQLPQRSYFLFGKNGVIQTYSLKQVLEFGGNSYNLRAFVGNPEIGFKMGLNHRMVAIFIGIIIGGAIWKLSGERPRLQPVWFLLMLAPLLIDGFSHMRNDHSGTGARYDNAWAIWLTGDIFPATFYKGTTVGTLNWLLRTITGLLFGFGFVWFLFSYMSYRFRLIRLKVEYKLRRAGAIGEKQTEVDNDTGQPA